MSERNERRELRGATYGAAPDALLQRLTRHDWPEDALQVVGEGVLVLAREPGVDIAPTARRCVRELRERCWRGDSELAGQIEAALGWTGTPMLLPLALDLQELAELLEGDPMVGGGVIDLSSGNTWPQSILDGDGLVDEDDPDLDDQERWLWVHCEGSRAGYHDMQLFTADLPDGPVADRLARSIEGRGAFRRFKDTLDEWPELLTRWLEFSDERQLGRARAWLAEQGYAAVPQQVEP